MHSTSSVETLRKQNNELISQLQIGLRELKTIASDYSGNAKASVRNQDINSNVQFTNSARITSTPKVKKITTRKDQSLIVNDFSSMMLDDGNLRPRKKMNPSRKDTLTSSKKTTQTKSKQSPVKFTKHGKSCRTLSKSRADKTPSKMLLNKSLKTPQMRGDLKPDLDAEKTPKKSILQSNKGDKTIKSNRVWFSSSVENNSTLSINETAVDTTMMGYDWIAGMLDNETVLSDKSDSFFNELREFRKENWNACKGIKHYEPNLTEYDSAVSPQRISFVEEKYPLCCKGNGAYMVNSRLNLVPIHGPYSACPSCKSKPISQSDEKGFVRVSIPKSNIKSPYKLRPHRRKSYDPSDSVALSMHCLAGWQAAKPACIRGPSNIDLITHSAKPGLTTLKAVKDREY